jgi:hypothetical protein
LWSWEQDDPTKDKNKSWTKLLTLKKKVIKTIRIKSGIKINERNWGTKVKERKKNQTKKRIKKTTIKRMSTCWYENKTKINENGWN